MQEKRGWSNQEWDSTIFMLFTLLIFAGFISANVFIKEFQDSDIAKNVMQVFNYVLGGMTTYFFGKAKQASNGNGEHK